jgi:hypothetical protein
MFRSARPFDNDVSWPTARRHFWEWTAKTAHKPLAKYGISVVRYGRDEIPPEERVFKGGSP